MTQPIHPPTMRAAMAVARAMEALDEALNEANVGEIYVEGPIALKIDGQTIAVVAYEDDAWCLIPVPAA